MTIYDIAKEAKVSIATVSRAFNNHPRVSSKTRKRIFEIAERHNYRPNVSAQNLARQNTYVISAIVPMMTSMFFMEVIRGIQGRLENQNFDLNILPVLSPEQSPQQLERALQRGRSDAVLLFSTWITDEQAEWISSFKQPLVLVDSNHPRFDSISVDNRRGGYLATQHLLASGYENIGLVAANPESVPSRERIIGYQQALVQHGLKVRKMNMVESKDMRLHGFSEESGYEDAKRLLMQSGSLDAIVVTSDVQALGVMRALREAGLRIPQDVALIGYDDVRLAAYTRLSTIRQPMYNMGYMAIDHLFRRLDDPAAPVTHLSLLPELVVRASTSQTVAETEGVLEVI